MPLSEFGAVTTRTLTVEPREGHFTTQDRWPLREVPGLLRRYGTVLRRTDAGFMNAFGWCNVGIDAYLRDYYPRTRDQWTIISLGGFSAAEFVTLIDRVNAAVPAGDIAAIELNVSCHNVNFDFSTILQDVLDEAVPRSNHPVLLKLSPDYDYLRNAAQAVRAGVAGLTAINTVKALRLDPRDRPPLLANRFGGLSGRASSRSGCGWSPSCATPGSPFRSSRPAGSGPPTTAASTSGRAPTRSASAVRSGWPAPRLRPRAAAWTGRSAPAADRRRSRPATIPLRAVARRMRMG